MLSQQIVASRPGGEAKQIGDVITRCLGDQGIKILSHQVPLRLE